MSSMTSRTARAVVVAAFAIAVMARAACGDYGSAEIPTSALAAQVVPKQTYDSQQLTIAAQAGAPSAYTSADSNAVPMPQVLATQSAVGLPSSVIEPLAISMPASLTPMSTSEPQPLMAFPTTATTAAPALASQAAAGYAIVPSAQTTPCLTSSVLAPQIISTLSEVMPSSVIEPLVISTPTIAPAMPTSDVAPQMVLPTSTTAAYGTPMPTFESPMPTIAPPMPTSEVAPQIVLPTSTTAAFNTPMPTLESPMPKITPPMPNSEVAPKIVLPTSTTPAYSTPMPTFAPPMPTSEVAPQNVIPTTTNPLKPCNTSTNGLPITFPTPGTDSQMLKLSDLSTSTMPSFNAQASTGPGLPEAPGAVVVNAQASTPLNLTESVPSINAMPQVLTTTSMPTSSYESGPGLPADSKNPAVSAMPIAAQENRMGNYGQRRSRRPFGRGRHNRMFGRTNPMTNSQNAYRMSA